MPLLVPIILGTISLLSAGVGVGAGVEAVELFNNARDISNRAKRKLEEGMESLKRKEKVIEEKVERLQITLTDIQNTTFSQLKELIKIASTTQEIGSEIANIAKQLLKAESYNSNHSYLKEETLLEIAISSIAKGVTLSAVTPVLLTSIASSFGTASTGAAISTLTGVAAKNAIMAWLGGGAFSAGGWGIAGGTIVSNLVTGGVGILVSGIALNISAEKALTEAKKYMAQVDIELTRIDSSIKIAEIFERKIEIVQKTISRINNLMRPYVESSFAHTAKQKATNTMKAVIMAYFICEILKININDRSLQDIEQILDNKLKKCNQLVNTIN